MTPHFELMDTASGNVVGDYTSETEALKIVRSAVERHGNSAVADLALAEIDGDETRVIAMSDDLLRLLSSRHLA